MDSDFKSLLDNVPVIVRKYVEWFMKEREELRDELEYYDYSQIYQDAFWKNVLYFALKNYTENSGYPVLTAEQVIYAHKSSKRVFIEHVLDNLSSRGLIVVHKDGTYELTEEGKIELEKIKTMNDK